MWFGLFSDIASMTLGGAGEGLYEDTADVGLPEIGRWSKCAGVVISGVRAVG